MFTHLKLDREVKIIRFGGDFHPWPESFDDLETLIKESEDLYPGIDLWYDRKVLPGLKNKDRRGFVIYRDDKPIGATIIKLAKDTKICSVRLIRDEQGKGIGHLLFSLIASEMRNLAKRVHFTTPESLWVNRKKFFNHFGFRTYGPAAQQYRLFEQELACGVSFNLFWANVIKALPKTLENFTINGNNNDCDIVLSTKPEFAQRIVQGTKKIEIRRRFSTKWAGSRALIYASSPLRQFVGEAVIGEIQSAEPWKIWEAWKSEIGCSWEEYSSYCNGADKVFAVFFSQVERFKVPIPKTQVEALIKDELNPPQSHCEIKKDTVWPAAVSLSYLLRVNL